MRSGSTGMMAIIRASIRSTICGRFVRAKAASEAQTPPGAASAEPMDGVTEAGS